MPDSYSPPEALYVHHSQVPQSVVESNPAEWYYPSSESTNKLYSSKKVPTFTPAAGWTEQEYADNLKNYRNQINDFRASYNKALMSAKDLMYRPVSVGWGPFDPVRYIGFGVPVTTNRVIDAQGNYVDNPASYNNTNNGVANEGEVDKSRNSDRVTYSNSDDISGDSFRYGPDLRDSINGFKSSTVSGLRDWNYNPYKAARHPDYATQQGHVASWDRIKGIPTLRRVTPVRDGDRYYTRTTTIPDYSASLERFTRANNTRLPNFSGKVTVADLENSGLLSKPQTIQYDSVQYDEDEHGKLGWYPRKRSEEGVRTARLQDLLTDRLLVPGNVDRSVQVSKLLSDAIGDARKSAILNTAASNNYNHKPLGSNILSALRTHTRGRAHLAGVDNLSLPITFVDDVRGEGDNMRYKGDGLYSYLAEAFPLSRVDPRYGMYRDKGIVRVITGSDSSSWSPGSSVIRLSEPDRSQRNSHLLDSMRASSEANKFNKGLAVGADYHHNDLPANGTPRGDIRSALLHEGIHASTGFNSNIIDSPELRSEKKLEQNLWTKYEDDSPNADKRRDLWHKIRDYVDALEEDPAHKTTALGAALGVSREGPNKTSRGYASNSEAEMLRALHHAKSGFARHLINDRHDLQPDEVVDEVQNPDKFLDFMQGVYKGSMKGDNDDPTSYSFPSSMSQAGTENEMARSIAGIQPLIQTLIESRRRERPSWLENNNPQIPSPKDNHIFRNKSGDPNRTLWKDKLYTPKEQLDIFRKHIWPQVRNNNNADKNRTLV